MSNLDPNLNICQPKGAILSSEPNVRIPCFAIPVLGTQGAQGIPGEKGDKGDKGESGLTGDVDASTQITGVLPLANGGLGSSYVSLGSLLGALLTSRPLVPSDIPNLSGLYDITGSASNALNSSNIYTDSHISNLSTVYDTKGTAATLSTQAQNNAKTYTDSLASNYDPAGTATSTSNAALTQANIYSANADHLTTGTVALNRLPGLPASQITSGVLDASRIPALPYDTTGAANTVQGNLNSLASSLGTASTKDISYFDLSGSASTAQNNAKIYTDSLASNYDSSGSANNAVISSNSYTDSKIATERNTASNASNLTSGTVPLTQIPSLPASQISSGVLDVARIPALNYDISGAAGTAQTNSENYTDTQITTERTTASNASNLTVGQVAPQRLGLGVGRGLGWSDRTLNGSGVWQTEVAPPASGYLQQASAVSLSVAGVGQNLGPLCWHPTGSFLYRTDVASSDLQTWTLYAHRVTQAGNIDLIASYALPSSTTTAANILFPAVDPSGKFLFLHDTNAGQVFSYSIATDGSLTALSSITLSSAPTAGVATYGTIQQSTPLIVYPGPNLTKLYALTGTGVSCITFAADGTLTDSQDLTVSSALITLAIRPGGSCLYCADYITGIISTVALDPSGVMSLASTITAPTVGIYSLAMDSYGRFLYAGTNTNAGLYSYSIGSGGALASITNARSTGGVYPASMAVDPSGTVLYTADGGGAAGILTWPISSTGALTETVRRYQPSHPTVAGISYVTQLAVDPTGRFIATSGLKTGGNNFVSIQNVLPAATYALDTFSRQTGLLAIGSINVGYSITNYIVTDSAGAYAYTSSTGGVTAFSLSGPTVTKLANYAGITNGNTPLILDPTENYLYALDYNNKLIISYSVAAGVLTQIGTVACPLNPLGLCCDSSGNIYCVGSSTSGIYSYSSASGVLTQIGTQALALGCLTCYWRNGFLYVSARISATIGTVGQIYIYSTSAGVLTQVGLTTTSNGYAYAFTSDATYLYAAVYNVNGIYGNSIQSFTVNATTGLLTVRSTVTTNAALPFNMVINNGKLYLGCGGTGVGSYGTANYFSIASGILTPLGYYVGSGNGLAVDPTGTYVYLTTSSTVTTLKLGSISVPIPLPQYMGGTGFTSLSAFLAGVGLTLPLSLAVGGTGIANSNTLSFLAGTGAGGSGLTGIGNYNVYIGASAGSSGTSTYSGNTAVGYQALQDYAGLSSSQTAFGYQAFQHGGGGTAIGYQAGWYATGLTGTWIGQSAGAGSVSLPNGGNANTGVGVSSLYSLAGTTTTNGCYNTALGYQSGYYTSTAIRCLILGFQAAGSSTTTGCFTDVNCCFIGPLTGHASSVPGNTTTLTNANAFGYAALVDSSNQCVYGNTSITQHKFAGGSILVANGITITAGATSLGGTLGVTGISTFTGNAIFNAPITPYAGAAGTSTIIIGSGAGNTSTTGTFNLILGYQSGAAIVAGGSNTFIGAQSGGSLSSGTGNTFVGRSSGTPTAGTVSTTDVNCTYMGAYSGHAASVPNTTTINNSTALGYGAGVTASNQVVIGNSSITATILGAGSLTVPNGLTVTAGATSLGGTLTVATNITATAGTISVNKVGTVDSAASFAITNTTQGFPVESGHSYSIASGATISFCAANATTSGFGSIHFVVVGTPDYAYYDGTGTAISSFRVGGNFSTNYTVAYNSTSATFTITNNSGAAKNIQIFMQGAFT